MGCLGEPAAAEAVGLGWGGGAPAMVAARGYGGGRAGEGGATDKLGFCRSKPLLTVAGARVSESRKRAAVCFF
jgi:hypothetical protein